jgi:Kdo2-lipid IVA lauroyltransferase/acyltransferase
MRAFLAITFIRLLSYLSLAQVHAFAAALARLALKLNPALAQVARTNITLCLPQLSAAAQDALASASVQESAKTLLEMGILWRRPCQKVATLVREVHGETFMRAAMAQGHGVILLTPHLGAWEMAGLYASLHYPITSLYRPPKLTRLEHFVRHGREHCGARLVPTDASGVRALFQALKRGEVAGILPDQDPGARGMGDFAPFFGNPAYTMLLVARLARKTGAPVIFTFAERLPQGAGFRMHFLPAHQTIADDDDKRALTALNHGVECCARQCLAQYQWSYKRFKTRPPNTASIYDSSRSEK